MLHSSCCGCLNFLMFQLIDACELSFELLARLSLFDFIDLLLLKPRHHLNSALIHHLCHQLLSCLLFRSPHSQPLIPCLILCCLACLLGNTLLSCDLAFLGYHMLSKEPSLLLHHALCRSLAAFHGCLVLKLCGQPRGILGLLTCNALVERALLGSIECIQLVVRLIYHLLANSLHTPGLLALKSRLLTQECCFLLGELPLPTAVVVELMDLAIEDSLLRSVHP
mmetsp:Transcript_11593/g.35932  ORF Transcript_11593/g.35932 Transcript_11593/m.35932 type:complete len:224 (+) Transcript_11593:582-1253(+)